jgi:hypothetical protein
MSRLSFHADFGLGEGWFPSCGWQSAELALHELVHDPPCLILAAEGASGHSVETLTRNLKLDAILGRLPLVVFVRETRLNEIDWGAWEWTTSSRSPIARKMSPLAYVSASAVDPLARRKSSHSPSGQHHNPL